MANLIVLNPQRGDSSAITAVSASVITANGQYGPTGFATYTGTFSAGANNGLQGQALTIAGFVNASNNGTFQVLGSTATTVLLNNSFAKAETHAATASRTTQGTPAQYGSKVENMFSNQNGDFTVVNAAAGDTLVAIVIGLRQIVNFDQLHGTAPYYPQFGNSAGTGGDYPSGGFALGQLAGLNDYNASPTISDQANGAAVDIIATSITANVLTVTYTNPNPVSASLTQANYFSATQSVALSGTAESFLNGTSVVVSTVTAATFERLTNGQIVQKTPAMFTAAKTHANYSNQEDSGSAQPAGNTWTLVGNSSITDSDYTVTYPFSGPLANGSFSPSASGYVHDPATGGRIPVPGWAGGSAVPSSNEPSVLTPSNAYQASQWNLDGYYPSLFIFVASNVAAGSYKVNVNSMFQTGDGADEWAQGSEPIFDGGVNVQVYNFSGCATSAAVDSSSFPLSVLQPADTTSNPATAPASLTASGSDGDVLISVGLMKSNNVFSVGTVSGTATGDAITNIAITSNVLTVTATNSFVAGNKVLLNGLTTATFLNGQTVTVLTSPGATFTAAFTHANYASAADTGTASLVESTPMIQIGNGKLVGSELHYIVEYGLVPAGTYNPGFANPLGYSMLVASLAIKSA